MIDETRLREHTDMLAARLREISGALGDHPQAAYLLGIADAIEALPEDSETARECLHKK